MKTNHRIFCLKYSRIYHIMYVPVQCLCFHLGKTNKERNYGTVPYYAKLFKRPFLVVLFVPSFVPYVTLSLFEFVVQKYFSTHDGKVEEWFGSK